MSRFLLAIAVVVGLAGCGSSNEDAVEVQDARSFENVRVTRNADSTFTLKDGYKTIGNIMSFHVKDSPSQEAILSVYHPGRPHPRISAATVVPCQAEC
jgi:hypothetical protein